MDELKIDQSRTILEDWMLIDAVYRLTKKKRRGKLENMVASKTKISEMIGEDYGIAVEPYVLDDRLNRLLGTALDRIPKVYDRYKVYWGYRIHPKYSPGNDVYTPEQMKSLIKELDYIEKRNAENRDARHQYELEKRRAAYRKRKARKDRDARRLKALQEVYPHAKEPYGDIVNRWEYGLKRDPDKLPVRTSDVSLGTVIDIMKERPEKVLFIDMGMVDVMPTSDVIAVAICNGNGETVYYQTFGTFDTEETISYRPEPSTGNIPMSEIADKTPLLEDGRERKRIKDILDPAEVIVGYALEGDIDRLVNNGVKMDYRLWYTFDMMPTYAQIVGEWNDYFQEYTWQPLRSALKRYAEIPTEDYLKNTVRMFPRILNAMWHSPNRNREPPKE